MSFNSKSFQYAGHRKEWTRRCAAMQKAIDAGTEHTLTVVSKQPGTRNPKSVIAA
jgi:hypothetical protein